MATTKNTYTQSGSTTNYAFTFPYIKQADVKVSLDNVVKSLTSDYTFADATTISFNSAPTAGTAIAIYRSTDDSNLVATFYPGSAIRSTDLNDNYTQNLYSTQENTNDATDALNNSRVLESGAYVSAITKATAAVTTANSASTSASSAVTTANTASTNATNAVNTANTANTTAGNAVTTANAATTTANAATTTANGAVTTANTASTNATNAVNTANTANTTAGTANTTANTASTNASAAVSTANTASTNASNAVTTANAAAADVAAAVLYTTVANKAALEALTPSEDGYYQISDSTALANATWGTPTYTLSGIPGTYPSSALDGITTRLSFTLSSKTFAYTSYTVNDADNRYLAPGDLLDEDNMASNSATKVASQQSIKAYVDLKAPLATPTFTGTSTFTGQVNLDNDAGLFINGDIYIRRDSAANKNYIECTHTDEHDLVIEVQDGKSITLQTDDQSSGYETLAKFQGDGAAELYYNNVKKIETTTGGAKVTGSLEVTSSFQGTYASSSVGEKFKIMRVTASGNPDTVDGRQYTTYYTTMQVDDAEDLFVELHEDTIFEIKWDNPNAYANDSLSTTDHGRLASFKPQAGVKLFYNDVKKFETTSSGVKVTGAAVPASITALTDGATIATDLALNNNYSVTLAGNRTLGQPSNQVVGQSGSIFVTQDGTGSRTLAYHADWKWVGGTAPTLTTTAAAVDRIDYIVAAANKIHAVASLDVK